MLTCCLCLLLANCGSIASGQQTENIQSNSANVVQTGTGEALPSTSLLTWQDDIASRLVQACDDFLARQLTASAETRESHWHRDSSSAESFRESVSANRQRLKHMLGLRDPRVANSAPERIVAWNTAGNAALCETDELTIRRVRWPVLSDPDPQRDTVIVYGEGLMIEPKSAPPRGFVIALPHCQHAPEEIVGIGGDLKLSAQFARRLAASGLRVIVPCLIDRQMEPRSVAPRGGANLTNREFLYRSSFELGRHLIGYEIQKVLALVDWSSRVEPNLPVGVIGYGEGGRLALFCGALDERIKSTGCSAAFGDQGNLWQQPLDRNVFGILTEFGDAQLARLCVNHGMLTLDDALLPREIYPGQGGGPAILDSPQHVIEEFQHFRETNPAHLGLVNFKFVRAEQVTYPNDEVLSHFISALDPTLQLSPLDAAPTPKLEAAIPPDRQRRQCEEIDLFNQLLLRESTYVRREFLQHLDTSSLDAFKASQTAYREQFRDQVIGHFDYRLADFNARSRQTWVSPKWTAYEVVLDVFDEVFAYGVLIIPNDMQAGEQRPVVVCQHGLEGRPTDVFLDDHPAYHNFAASLAERGFITFAPQNIYIFQDRFRVLQRKANPLGKTLFSFMVPQHQQIVNWLKTLPQVDPKRIGFYGLSYGGKSAMRIPALVPDYCLSICSADFNEWVLKNASTREPFSYVWTGEYEIFEFDLGSTFNYAEMATLIAPRPFMVERGHNDGVGWDEWVAHEYAKVRHLYASKLGIPERTEIEFFRGPHTINGEGTFAFLSKHLNWPAAEEE
ncbi:dienelactone hydrolase family protein [Planctomycetaceae bacterium SH139]